MLAKKVVDDKARQLVGRVDDALGAMTAMLNTLLDINQIEAGSVKPEFGDFPVNDLFDRLREELTYHAQAAGLELRVLRCGLSIRSDPSLLEQMVRNLISNALKYTPRGRVLLGCRRRKGKLRIEVWDTGIGIPESELKAVFEEYYQVDNAARQRSRGLGLGLSIVKSLGELLHHPIRVRSRARKGIGLLDRGSADARRRTLRRPMRSRARRRTHRRSRRRAPERSWSSRTIRKCASTSSCS